ncbi:MAG: hypothetical protein P8X46_03805 [Nitrospirales bacterium]
MGTEPPKKNTRAAEGAPSCIAQKAVSGSVIKTGDEGIAIGKGGITVGRLKVEKGARGVFIGDHVKEVFVPEEPPRLLSQDQAFQRIDAAVRSNLSQLELNKEKATNESNDFFWSNILFASLGFLVMLTGMGLLLVNLIAAGIVVTAIAVIPFVTAALFFRKDKELRVTIERHHRHILDSQRLLTMIDFAETVQDQKAQDNLKKEIIWRALGIEQPHQHSTAPVSAKGDVTAPAPPKPNDQLTRMTENQLDWE